VTPAESSRIAAPQGDRTLSGWRTNTTQRSIELDELMAGGPGKDGIPAILRPRFVAPEAARRWLSDQEPVISLAIGEESRAYPLQVLMWHEIVNDTIGGVPVAVTFCPLCYSADVFDRRVKDRVLTFGVSGFLRVSNMVMYDRQTESLWQQALGEAIVGELTGSTLKRLPAQIISFEQFREAHPKGTILSRETGYSRPYGRNPYVGYDRIGRSPFALSQENTKGLLPQEQLVTISVAGTDKAYPHRLTRQMRAINDQVGGIPLVVFHTEGAVSALDQARIAASREVGSTGVFDRRLGEQTLTFRYEEGRLRDGQTHSVWDITGKAVAGPLKGSQLTPIPHGDYFAFSWLVFKPDTEVFEVASEDK
jgi:hypothetical protein